MRHLLTKFSSCTAIGQNLEQKNHEPNVMFNVIARVTTPLWNQAVWLDVANHVTAFSQSECIISDFLHSQNLLLTLAQRLLERCSKTHFMIKVGKPICSFFCKANQFSKYHYIKVKTFDRNIFLIKIFTKSLYLDNLK